MKININVPAYVKTIQSRLIKNNYECFLVGGSIRDTLLNRNVKDYDLATNCDVKTLLNLFRDYNIVNKNGEKHNTITLHINNDNVEISTFKHSSEEINSINADLMHRDFTINALAYDTKLVDVVNGYSDLMNKVIRTPGDPCERFIEDPLRILRALRFSSILEFKIEEETSKAIHEYKSLLSTVSKERIKSELDQILSGNKVLDVLEEYKDVFFEIIPELKDTYDFDQRNKFHKNTLYKHLINVCKNVYTNNDSSNDQIVLTRTAALLHDIAKPKCFTIDDNGCGHFYGHAEKSAIIALDILKRLKYSNNEIEKILYLIRYHDITINLTEKSVKRNLSHVPNLDEELFYMLLELVNADKVDHTKYELVDITRIKEIIEKIKKDNLCLKLSDLKVNGYDMMKLGFKNKDIGLVLNYLLEAVIDEKIVNDKCMLIEEAINFKNNDNI